MAQILRLHKGGADTIEGWGDSIKIGTKAIDSIQDPVEATDKKEITSIPSPFARIDLTKRAFHYVVEHGLKGNTAYHKIVSNTLDVAQIFFNIEKYRDLIDIIVWDKKNHINSLLDSNIEEHRRLGNTYKTFIEQDGAEYNFGSMSNIYLLNYLEGPNVMNIIGATSPSTLFFTSANDLSYVKEKIKFGDDEPFDEEYKPLHLREIEFVKYLFALRENTQSFSSLFPEVYQYLEKSFTALSDDRKKEIRAITNNSYRDNYDLVEVTPVAQQYVTIAGLELRRKKTLTHIDSGFEMLVSHNNGTGKIPLALPVETYTLPTKYVTSNWNKDTYVPYFNDRAIDQRSLPDDGSIYPYVTIGDFLEDTIIKTRYPFNKVGYFDGNDDSEGESGSFLLPLTKTYFDYFTVADLKKVINGKKAIEIQRLTADGVKVILRIPIKSGGFVQYERLYYAYYPEATPDRKSNKGSIVLREFTIGQIPAIHYPDNVKPNYRIALLDRDSVQNRNNPYSLKFYNSNNEEVIAIGQVRRNRNSDDTRITDLRIDSTTYVLEKNYDYMIVSDGDISAVVIPIFTKKNGSRTFRFAIDFGTTNTHIEYTIDDSTSQPFDIRKSEMQIQKLHNTDDENEIREVFNADLIPETIGTESDFGYPMRTVLSESLNTNWSKAVFTLANTNIPFTYEKSMPLPYNVMHTDLKWSSKTEDKQRAEKYIENLMLLLQNKVLLNNGDLSKTQIVWFYPASMIQSRFDNFSNIWKIYYKKLFNGDEQNIISMSESVAPYYYHKDTSGATSTVVSIDVGGGTTDVLFVEKGKPRYLTSFRFAANTIFGDGYSYNSDTNGIVKKYSPIISSLLLENNLDNLKKVLDSLIKRKVSSDIIAFFFSLKNNKDILKKKVEINFNQMLSEDRDFKYVTILFFVAIIYHIACIMKAKDMSMPRHIAFSGNGSKVFSILTSNEKTLERFAKLIFQKVYQKEYPEDGLSVIRPENSKETTCKGGISSFMPQDYSQIEDMKTILLGVDESAFVSNTIKYEDITETMKEQVILKCKNFIDFTFGLNDEFSFYKEFEANNTILEDVRKICFRDIRTFLDNGIELKKEEIMKDGANDALEETLFFYPLIGILNAMVRDIYNI